MGEFIGCGQSWRRRLSDAAATRALGGDLAERLLEQGPRLLLLEGDLGAGKTCLVQGLAQGLGISEPITSPTFALAQHYAGQRAGRTTTWFTSTSTAWSSLHPPKSCSPRRRRRPWLWGPCWRWNGPSGCASRRRPPGGCTWRPRARGASRWFRSAAVDSAEGFCNGSLEHRLFGAGSRKGFSARRSASPTAPASPLHPQSGSPAHAPWPGMV